MEILDIVNEENKLINKKQTRQYIHENREIPICGQKQVDMF